MRWDLERLKNLSTMESKYLDPREIEHLTSCRLCANLGTDHATSSGPPDAPVVLAMFTPTSEAVETGEPFTGAYRQLVELMLDRANLLYTDVYKTHVVKCKTPGGRQVSAPECRNCMQTWFSQEVHTINPVVVVLFGKLAAEAVLKDTQIFEHGKKVVSKSGRAYIMSYHPSWFVRNGQVSEFLELGNLINECLGGSSEQT